MMWRMTCGIIALCESIVYELRVYYVFIDDMLQQQRGGHSGQEQPGGIHARVPHEGAGRPLREGLNPLTEH